MMHVRVYASADEVLLVWRPPGPIKDCRGFAVFRQANGAPSEAIPSWVGFENAAVSAEAEPHGRPSTEWPVQKYMWTDYLARAGDRVRYRIVPMIGSAGSLDPAWAHASAWTRTLKVGRAPARSVSAAFNRGIVASQWLSRRIGALPGGSRSGKILKAIETVGDPLRDFMSGDARATLREPMQRALDDPSIELYAALFELDDPELVADLCALGQRAHVVLANGAVKARGEDENSAARGRLLASNVDVRDRFTAPSRLAHNKYLITVKAGVATQVLTGSTNWTKTGLCTQANNVLRISDRSVASWYLDAWKRIAAAGSATPAALIDANSKPRSRTIGSRRISAWLTPVSGLADLTAATQLINSAEQGIVFLMFMPGASGTLLNSILERGREGSPSYDGALYVNGVVNQDPSTAKQPVVLYHRGTPTRLNYDVVLPGAIGDPLSYWLPELLKLPKAHAMVHSKTIVLDPFGARPVVMTGSHNLGPRASSRNDDNLVIIEGDRALAEAYAVEMMSIYGHYRWRQRVAEGSRWRGLWDNDRWQRRYFSQPELQAESRFWLGD